jgi:hypothetical protein
MKLAILIPAAGLALAAPVLEAADPAAMVYLQVPFGDVSAARPESASFGLKLGISRRDQDPFVTRPVDTDPIRSSVDLRFTGDGARGLNLRGIGNILGPEGRPLAFRPRDAADSDGRAIGPGIVAPDRTSDGVRLDALGDTGWSTGPDAAPR